MSNHTGNDADTISHSELKARRKFLKSVGHEFVEDGRVHELHSKSVRTRVRRGHDARMLKTLGDDRVRAMELIWSAYMMIASPLQAAVFNPFRTGGGGADPGRGKALQQLYWAWAREVQSLKLDHAMCIDVAVEGNAPRAVADARRVGYTKVFNNLVDCLDVSIRLGILKLWRDDEL